MTVDLAKTLIGKRIDHISNTQGLIELEDGTSLSFDTDWGDCCGYADVEFNLEGIDFTDNVITNVTPKEIKDYYSDVENFTITIFTKDNRFTIEGAVGSGSGWDYGQCIKVDVKRYQEGERR